MSLTIENIEKHVGIAVNKALGINPEGTQTFVERVIDIQEKVSAIEKRFTDTITSKKAHAKNQQKATQNSQFIKFEKYRIFNESYEKDKALIKLQQLLKDQSLNIDEKVSFLVNDLTKGREYIVKNIKSNPKYTKLYKSNKDTEIKISEEGELIAVDKRSSKILKSPLTKPIQLKASQGDQFEAFELSKDQLEALLENYDEAFVTSNNLTNNSLLGGNRITQYKTKDDLYIKVIGNLNEIIKTSIRSLDTKNGENYYGLGSLLRELELLNIIFNESAFTSFLE